MVVEGIVARHFEEASTLWWFRDAAVDETQRDLDSLAGLDERLAAHLDGLRIAQDAGWSESQLDVNLADPGEAFVRTVLSLETRQLDLLNGIMDAAASEAAVARAVVSAFGWTSAAVLRGIVKDMLASPEPFRRAVAIAACAIHRVDPGGPLREAVGDVDERLACRALRAAGELGITDISLDAAGQPRDSCSRRFWAAWASVLTGDRDLGLNALADLELAVDYRRRAMQLLLRSVTPEAARDWLRGLRELEGSTRDLLVGVGIVGDPSYVPWLISRMEVVEEARLAGHAFAMITGVNFADAHLKRARPADFVSGPSDDPDADDVAVDPDQELDWPDPELVRKWWDANAGRFAAGHRFLAGSPIQADHCLRLLRIGRQGFRVAAAFELALMKADAILFNTSAPGWRQERALRL
jgi:uncharacterized protein (TIGR02270 family)